MKVKEVFDKLFQGVRFDNNFYKKIVVNNIEFITRNNEFKNLFGSKLIGNHLVKYTMYDKDIFYGNLFDMTASEIIDAIDQISTINKNFKIARDDVNLVCFYIAHRFLSNKDLKKEQAEEYAREILDYFNYRTLVLISSNYFVYPISEEKALTLIERLNNKYIIKKVKNWNEYCQYRSQEYVDSKFRDLLVKFNRDPELPNAITDLFNRTKDTIKNIYAEFIDMNENDDIIKSRKNIINDVEGAEVIVDKLDTPEKYFIKIENMLVEKNTFVKKDYINVVTDIINSVSFKQVEETLTYICDFNFSTRENNQKVLSFVNSVLVNTIDYLNKNSIFLHNKSDIISVMNMIVGNVLYARGTDIEINKVKDQGDKLIKEIYKSLKKSITERNIKNIRNAVYIYIVLRAVID